ncbi:MAG: phage integrase SAM-like domain-containing protein, partial [Bacteroidales bacterium]
MANINFYLKSVKPDKKGLKPILLQITFNYKRFRLHTGEKVKPALWNSKKQRIFEKRNFNNEKELVRINNFLDNIEADVKDLINDTKLKKIELSEAYFKNNLFKKENKSNNSFFELFNEYIETNKSTRAERTIKGYTTVMNFLKKFESQTNFAIDINTLDLMFFDKLKEFAFLKMKIADNYFSKIIAVLKSFLNWAKDRNHHNNDIHRKFKAPEKEKEIIYLTIDELMKLTEYNFELERHQKARDLYCFGCYTGLRVSDINQLRREHIKDNVIYKTIQKTKSYETIPISSFAQNILNKYNDLPLTPLPTMSEQKLNKYIKKCCEIAEINESVNIVKFSGGKSIEITKPKYDLITI